MALVRSSVRYGGGPPSGQVGEMDPDTAELLLESGRVQDMSTLEGRTGRKPRPKRKAKPKAKPDA